ncbi:MAG: hypothetical protein H6985_12150 [Pseudomonadales bacterium]|nr:hypothetical protein [Halioglobus sp.]MCP5130324.1 hypothetical protein [Pseudomonadales bacterium]
MKFSKFLAAQLQCALSFSLSLGLLVGLLVLVIGRAEGTITVDIDLTAADSIWFISGIPLVVTILFFLCSPVAFYIQRGISRAFRYFES